MKEKQIYSNVLLIALHGLLEEKEDKLIEDLISSIYEIEVLKNSTNHLEAWDYIDSIITDKVGFYSYATIKALNGLKIANVPNVTKFIKEISLNVKYNHKLDYNKLNTYLRRNYFEIK